MIQPTRYFCYYCDLSGNDEKLIKRHIRSFHQVKDIREIDRREILTLG